MSARDSRSSASLSPVTMNGFATMSTSAMLRPDFAAPSSIAGRITLRTYSGVFSGCIRIPSHSSPAMRQL